jgi:hypothetical protein
MSFDLSSVVGSAVVKFGFDWAERVDWGSVRNDD